MGEREVGKRKTVEKNKQKCQQKTFKKYNIQTGLEISKKQRMKTGHTQNEIKKKIKKNLRKKK